MLRKYVSHHKKKNFKMMKKKELDMKEKKGNHIIYKLEKINQNESEKLDCDRKIKQKIGSDTMKIIRNEVFDNGMVKPHTQCKINNSGTYSSVGNSISNQKMSYCNNKNENSIHQNEYFQDINFRRVEYQSSIDDHIELKDNKVTKTKNNQNTTKKVCILDHQISTKQNDILYYQNLYKTIRTIFNYNQMKNRKTFLSRIEQIIESRTKVRFKKEDVELLDGVCIIGDEITFVENKFQLLMVAFQNDQDNTKGLNNMNQSDNLQLDFNNIDQKQQNTANQNDQKNSNQCKGYTTNAVSKQTKNILQNKNLSSHQKYAFLLEHIEKRENSRRKTFIDIHSNINQLSIDIKNYFHMRNKRIEKVDVLMKKLGFIDQKLFLNNVKKKYEVVTIEDDVYVKYIE